MAQVNIRSRWIGPQLHTQRFILSESLFQLTPQFLDRHKIDRPLAQHTDLPFHFRISRHRTFSAYMFCRLKLKKRGGGL
jgi:hypothetical protein